MSNLALKLNGETSYADIPNFNLLKNYTIEFAIKPYNLSGIQMIINNENSFAIGFYNGNLIFTDKIVSMDIIKINEWNYITVTFNIYNEPTVFINGKEQSTLGNDPWTYLGNFIGKRRTGNYFNGEIDEIRIWNKIISKDRMLAYKQKGNVIKGTEDGLIAYYIFNNKILDKIINLVNNSETNMYNCEYSNGTIINIIKYLINQNNNYYLINSNFLNLGQPTDNTQLENWYNKYGSEDINIITQNLNNKVFPMSKNESGIWETDFQLDMNDITDNIDLVDIDENNKSIKYDCNNYRILDLCDDEFDIMQYKEK
ncbi:LamG domain-containing protein [Clostridium botulinum]